MKIKLATQEQIETLKEDYMNQRQQDQLKIATVEKELNDYKSTMANINVNQEAKQKVSNYGTVSLPKNAANGQVSMSLKGETRVNLLNINYLETTSGTVGTEQVILKPNTQYTLSAFVDASKSVSDGFRIRANDNVPNYFVGNIIIAGEKGWSVITFNTGNNTEFNIAFQRILGETVDTNIKTASHIMLEETDKRKVFITGAKSTISASRLKSVGKDRIQESTSYLPNVGELRSLSNGVRDEIRVNGGKAELVKRVSDTMEELAEPIITPIEASGTLLSYPSGIVYVENVVADAGIYDSGISVLHQDLPIREVEKLSKVDFTTGLETELDISKVVVSEDRKSFTHPNLVDGDILFFTYFHNIEGTQGELSVEYYDSRHTLKDDVTGKFYKIVPKISDGVLVNELVEV